MTEKNCDNTFSQLPIVAVEVSSRRMRIQLFHYISMFGRRCQTPVDEGERTLVLTQQPHQTGKPVNKIARAVDN